MEDLLRDLEFNGANATVLLSVILSIVGFSIYGLTQRNFILFGTGVAMGVVLGMSYLMIGDNLWTSPYPADVNALSGVFFFVLGTIASGGSTFSVYNTTSKSYLSMLSGADEAVKAVLDVHFAPYVENSAILGSIMVTFYILRAVRPGSIVLGFLPDEFLDFGYLLLATAGGGALFGGLHGSAEIAFFMRAFLVMSIMSILVLGADLGYFDAGFVATGIISMYFFHRGLNTGTYGGLFETYDILLSADFPVNIISAIIVAGDLMIFYLAFRAVPEAVAEFT